MGFVKEFKDFAMRGNLVDMAVAVVMGGAFGKVVTSFVDGIVMPLVGRLLLNIDFAKYNIILQEEIKDGDKVVQPLVQVGLGNFITTIIDFVLVSLAVFLVIKGINRLRKNEEAKPTTPPEPTKDQVLLTEIRDLLKDQKK
ncbi:MAG: large-conductance mechanosensitive channel protein MscL [Bacteroidia bacterium]|nr:large-conductance mechanosensitive channel protein MscL [Bacteroidia bacterium]